MLGHITRCIITSSAPNIGALTAEVTATISFNVQSRMLASLTNSVAIRGYWHQRADESHGNPLQGNQKPLVVKDKFKKTLQVTLG